MQTDQLVPSLQSVFTWHSSFFWLEQMFHFGTSFGIWNIWARTKSKYRKYRNLWFRKENPETMVPVQPLWYTDNMFFMISKYPRVKNGAPKLGWSLLLTWFLTKLLFSSDIGKLCQNEIWDLSRKCRCWVGKLQEHQFTFQPQFEAQRKCSLWQERGFDGSKTQCVSPAEISQSHKHVFVAWNCVKTILQSNKLSLLMNNTVFFVFKAGQRISSKYYSQFWKVIVGCMIGVDVTN